MTTLGAPMNYLVSHGPRADPVTGLTWGLMILSLAVVVIIGVLVPLGVVLRARRTADTASQPIERSGEGLWWIYIGLGLTIAALIAALFWTMQVLAAVNAPRHPTQLTIEVVGHQWWWEFRYLGAPGQAFTTANEMHIPVGRPVMLRLNGADVIHSFWVPALTGKTDTIPGRTNIGWLQADQPGVYAGMCTEYCGVQHAHMAVSVTAETPAAFETWRQGQINPAADVTAPRRRGRTRGGAGSLRNMPYNPRDRRPWRARTRPYPSDEPRHPRRRHPSQRPRCAHRLDRQSPGAQARRAHAGDLPVRGAAFAGAGLSGDAAMRPMATGEEVRTPEVVAIDGDFPGARLEKIWRTDPGLIGWLSSVDHKEIGKRYIITALAFLLIGGLEALVMRVQLAGPNRHLLTPEAYDQLFTMHGVTMIFLYAAPVLSGFSNFLWPLLLGSRDMAFPRLNALSYWVYIAAGLFMYAGFVVGHGPNAGWFNYVPYAGKAANPGVNIDIYSSA